MAIPPGVLPPELANDIGVVTRKAGLTPWHERLLGALERIADAQEETRRRVASLDRKAGKSDA